MDLLSEYINILHSHLPSGAKISSKCTEMNCPACIYMGERRADTRGRGGFFNNGSEIGYNCFNCGFKFRASNDRELPFKAIKLLELLHVPHHEISKLHFLALKLNPMTRRVLKKEKVTVNLNFQEVELPSNTYILHDIIADCDIDSDAFKAYIFAKRRGIGEHPLLLWSESTYRNLNKRLIIPYMYGDMVVGYTGRMFEEPKSKSDRFFNHNPNHNYVFNVDSILRKDRRVVIINESVFDSLLLDGVGMMGAFPNKQQVDIINSFKGRKILVPDFNEAGIKSIDVAIKNGWEVFFPKWSHSLDLGESVQNFGKLFVLENILNESMIDPLEIEVKRNLL